MLRSGIIIPFQFREHKKLLMIGGPEENRDLNLWDLKNVVRAAFGIYNFEFRNKKIDFNIPDDLLLNYLSQRHDLTNFVIEIRQANDDNKLQIVSATTILPTKVTNTSATEVLSTEQQQPQQQQQQQLQQQQQPNTHTRSPINISPLNNNSDHSSNQEPPQKIRIAQVFSEHTNESMTQSLDPMDIIPKSENDDTTENNDMFEVKCTVLQPHHLHQQSNFFTNYQPTVNGNLNATVSGMLGNVTLTQSHQYPPGMMNRFRRRGERMSKDQKEIYVKYFEENPCMLTQRRNDVVLEPHWNKLANLLNSVPQGAIKNVEEWKQTFDAWRYRVFMYTRYNSKLIGAAAQNPKNYKPLTTTDQRAYAMWTSHKNTTPSDFEKMDMFASLDETPNDYDY